PHLPLDLQRHRPRRPARPRRAAGARLGRGVLHRRHPPRPAALDGRQGQDRPGRQEEEREGGDLSGQGEGCLTM
ncbi:hypothetical protein E4U41_005604, partial [Claviceps citrina]